VGLCLDSESKSDMCVGEALYRNGVIRVGCSINWSSWLLASPALSVKRTLSKDCDCISTRRHARGGGPRVRGKILARSGRINHSHILVLRKCSMAAGAKTPRLEDRSEYSDGMRKILCRSNGPPGRESERQ